MITQNSDNYLVSNIFPGSVESGFGTVNSVALERISDLQECQRIEMLQVHGAEIREIDIDFKNMQKCDGLFTNKKDVGLLVKTADCLPILFYDEKKKFIGAAHAGWKGTVARISENMIHFFCDHGSTPENIKVAIGPGIGACSYEVTGERLKIIQSAFPEWPGAYQDNKLNLLQLNYLQLISLGVSAKNIDYFPFCTTCDSQRFYSYNRDRSSNRMYSYIALK